MQSIPENPLGTLLARIIPPFQKRQLVWEETLVDEIAINGVGNEGPVEAVLNLDDQDRRGKTIVIKLAPIEEKDIPEKKSSERNLEISAAWKVLLSHFLLPGTSLFVVSNNDSFVEFVFRHNDEFVICSCYTDNTTKGRQKLRDDEFRLKYRESREVEKQLALERKRAALEKEASQRGFPDVASMQAADAAEAQEQEEAKRQQRYAEKAERDLAERAAEAAEKAKKAEVARLGKAKKEALDEAARLEKFGGKKSSPPLGGQAGRR
jgi:hypothetical protein